MNEKPENTLSSLAREALEDMLRNGKLSAGDLIKLLAVGADKGPTHSADFVIKVYDTAPKL